MEGWEPDGGGVLPTEEPPAPDAAVDWGLVGRGAPYANLFSTALGFPACSAGLSRELRCLRLRS